VHMVGVVGTCGKDVFQMEEHPILEPKIYPLLKKIRLFKSLLEHPKINYKLFQKPIFNWLSTITPFSFDTLSVQS
jgi:hypothetical protein